MYQTGQTISTVGDACGTIALTWWILDVTNSPAMISTILAPAMGVQMLLTPLFGPLGDRLSRKSLILKSDVIRAIAMVVLASLALRGLFVLPVMIGVYAVFTSGSALFSSNHMSIVPQLVSPDALQRAVRMSQSLQAIGRVMGGVIAGILVSTAGVGWTLLLDAFSFGIAALMTAAIGRLVPPASLAASRNGLKHEARPFMVELKNGFAVIHRVPVLFWLCMAMAFFNLLLSPMQYSCPRTQR